MKVILVCVWDVIIYTCIINVCQIYLSSFQENIKIHCFILNVKLKINSLLKICEVNISKKIFTYTLLVSEQRIQTSEDLFSKFAPPPPPPPPPPHKKERKTHKNKYSISYGFNFLFLSLIPLIDVPFRIRFFPCCFIFYF